MEDIFSVESDSLFGSIHYATFNMLMCDGSVRQIRYDVDPTLLPPLAAATATKWSTKPPSKKGGEPHLFVTESHERLTFAALTPAQ